MRGPSITARLAAIVALVAFALAQVTLVVFLIGNLLHLLGASACVAAGVWCAWVAATNHGRNAVRWTLAVVLLAGAVVLLFAGRDSVGSLVVVVSLVVIVAVAGRRALRAEVAAAVARRWSPAPAARRPVLLMNPWSGGHKVERFGLVDEARSRGIEPVVLQAGDDLQALAESAVARGADVIGMAGGDGSQAIVAAVAADHGVAFVCVPAGTRNHLAMDLGVDRDDVVGALDAFGPAREARVDLGTVNGRVFVNNVSLGVYAAIVQSDAYRDAKSETVSKLLPELMGPRATPFDLQLDGPDGRPIEGVQLVQVSNDPYRLDRLAGFGTRPRLDAGSLGIAALHLGGPADVTTFLALEAAGRVRQFPGWREWTAPILTVDSGAAVAAGVDGESMMLQPPLRFATRPGALLVRTAVHHPGASPAGVQPGGGFAAARGLARVVWGRPSGLFFSPSSSSGRDEPGADR